jgi:hypothetical protein
MLIKSFDLRLNQAWSAVGEGPITDFRVFSRHTLRATRHALLGSP